MRKRGGAFAGWMTSELDLEGKVKFSGQRRGDRTAFQAEEIP